MEILATGADINALASVKAFLLDLEADPNVVRYVEVIEKQPGWRFDLFVVGPEGVLPMPERPAGEPTEDDVRRTLDEVGRMLQAGSSLPRSPPPGVRWRRRCAGASVPAAGRPAGGRRLDAARRPLFLGCDFDRRPRNLEDSPDTERGRPRPRVAGRRSGASSSWSIRPGGSWRNRSR